MLKNVLKMPFSLSKKCLFLISCSHPHKKEEEILTIEPLTVNITVNTRGVKGQRLSNYEETSQYYNLK